MIDTSTQRPVRAFLPALALGAAIGLAAGMLSLRSGAGRAQAAGNPPVPWWYWPASLLARAGGGGLLGLLLWAAYKAVASRGGGAPRYPGLGPG